MRKRQWMWVPVLVWLSGCCAHPGLFQKVRDSLELVQGYYEPLVQAQWNDHEQVRAAVVAADTTLLLAGELQRQWCPDPGKTAQLALQTQEAQKLAQQAGIMEPGTTRSKAGE